jgi:hypothetical protein
MNFGWVGVVVVPMVFGVIFSLVFEFQRRRPKDPFVLMLAVGVFLRFLPNMDAKMVAGIASLPISTLLPVGTLAAFAKPRARSSRIFMVFCFAAALFTLIAWRLVELESLKYATQAVLLLAYVGAAWAIWSPDTPPTTANPARKMGFAASRAAVRWDTRANTPEAWRTHLD